MVKILDCTIRDGGYYTNWDFDKDVVDNYFRSMNGLPVDYLEIGYRSIPLKGYYGKYFYNPIYELEYLRSISNKKFVVILNERDIKPEHINDLLTPIKGLVEMVRMAIDPVNLKSALVLAEKIKALGFEVGFNVMYMSKWKQYGNFISELKNVNGITDYFYMVDSYGGVYPNDVIETIGLLKQDITCEIGFHGHNNIELALVNSLTAIEHGVTIIDSTILGMGRGAGNLKTELLLAVLNAKQGLPVDLNCLETAVNTFEPLLEKHQWGTNLPYIISGTNSLPQKDVMDWVTTRFYSFNSIVRALQNKKDKLEDNLQVPVFKASKQYKKALIIGGGPTAQEHVKGLIAYLENEEDICVIHASAKNALAYKDVNVDQYYCLVGNEGHRLEKVFHGLGDFHSECILPPFPRKMGTYIPDVIKDKCFQLEKIDLDTTLTDSHCVLALQASIELTQGEVLFAGYDGYQESSINQMERILLEENESLFSAFADHKKMPLKTLTPSKYKIFTADSVYSHL